MAINTRDIMDDTVVKTVAMLQKLVRNSSLRLSMSGSSREASLLHNLSRRIIFLLSRQWTRRLFQKKRRKWKENCALYLRLYIACQVRDGNLEDFFKYENQPWPPSLSQLGQLRGGQKADLVKCLSSTSAQITTQPVADAVILVQMLQPRTARTFDEYFSTVFASYILRHLKTARRVDLVWDVYQDDSLKSSLREKRGSGQRSKVLPSTRIPADWKGFLRVENNKDELFKLIANKVYTWYSLLI